MQVHRAHEVDKRVPPRRNPQQTCNQKSSNQHTQTTAKNTHLLSFTVFFFFKIKAQIPPLLPTITIIDRNILYNTKKKKINNHNTIKEKKKKTKKTNSQWEYGIGDAGRDMVRSDGSVAGGGDEDVRVAVGGGGGESGAEDGAAAEFPLLQDGAAVAAFVPAPDVHPLPHFTPPPVVAGGMERRSSNTNQTKPSGTVMVPSNYI